MGFHDQNDSSSAASSKALGNQSDQHLHLLNWKSMLPFLLSTSSMLETCCNLEVPFT
jgi:hypothetical protein